MPDADAEINEPTYPKFYYETVKSFTGKIQFRADIGDRSNIEGLRAAKRGQVFEVKSEAFAERAVSGGYFSHVAESTPVGQPDEYKPATASETADAETLTETEGTE